MSERMTAAEADLLQGYLDGSNDYRDELPEPNNFSGPYAFGWLNGRDDRTQSPRADAQTLREAAAELLKDQSQ